jgi:hypothetical protein
MRIRALLAGFVGCSLLLAGCGGGSSGGSGPASTPTTHAAALTSNGVAKLAPTRALAKVRAAVKSEPSVHFTQKLVINNRILTIDIHAGRHAGTDDLIYPDGGRVRQEVVGGRAFQRGNSKGYQDIGLSKKISTAIGGEWIHAQVQYAHFSREDLITGLAVHLLQSSGPLKHGASTTIAGAPAGALVSPSKPTPGTLYFAATGKPLPIKLVLRGAHKELITYLGFAAPVTVVAPKIFVNSNG